MLKDVAVAAGLIGLPYVGGFLGSRVVTKNMDWYKTLNKPSFSPPAWVFGPMWSILYGCMGTASYLVWKEAGDGSATLPLAVYGAHLLLNWSWTHVFFGMHRLGEVCCIHSLGIGLAKSPLSLIGGRIQLSQYYRLECLVTGRSW